MSTEDNKQLCRRFCEEVFNQLDQNTTREIISPFIGPSVKTDETLLSRA